MVWVVLGPDTITPRSQELVDRVIDAMASPVQINILDSDETAKQLLHDYELLVCVKAKPHGTVQAPDKRAYHVGQAALERRAQMYRTVAPAALVLLLGTPSDAVLHTLCQTLRRTDDCLVIDVEQNIDQLEDVIATITTEPK